MLVVLVSPSQAEGPIGEQQARKGQPEKDANRKEKGEILQAVGVCGSPLAST